MALVFCYKDMLEKVTMQRTQQFSAFVCYRKNLTQLNATHEQLLEKLRPIALAETCRFLTIQSLPPPQAFLIFFLAQRAFE